ncbi:MAG: hypothetical protein IPM24_07860 [Bryobacterales bacterium]|nr:hypothetical protein [Bryobacterales bacterium]
MSHGEVKPTAAAATFQTGSDSIKIQIQAHRPEHLLVPGGIDAVSTRTLMFLVEARPGTPAFRYASVKAGQLHCNIEIP